MYKKKIKLLFLIFDLGGGGAEKVLVNLVNNLNAERYDITIRTLFGEGVNANKLKSNIEYLPFFKRKPFRGFTKILRLIPSSFLYKLFVKGKYDYEIAFLQHQPTRIIGGNRDKTTNKFAWVHIVSDSSRHLLNSYKNEKEFNSIYNSYNKIAFVSKEALESFERYYDIQTPKEVVHNVNEYHCLDALADEPIEIKINPDKINLIAIGRLTNQKRFDRLIDSLKSVDNKGLENYNLYILGEGEDKEKLQKQIDDNGSREKIKLLGFQKNPYKYLSKMDLFVCSSNKEGYSTAATEAIYLGIPVLTTDCGGMHDIIGDSKAGLIVENSQKGLEEGLEKLLTNPNLIKEMKLAAKERAKDFSTERAIREFEEFIGTADRIH